MNGQKLWFGRQRQLKNTNNNWRSHTLNLGATAKPQYTTELQSETVAVIRNSFRTEMSNFSNSLKYLGNLLNFSIIPVKNKKSCKSALLFGFSQQSGLCYRPQMRLQDVTIRCMKDLGYMSKPSSAINRVPEIPTQYATINVSLMEGDNPSNGQRQYVLYNSHLKRIRKLNRIQALE